MYLWREVRQGNRWQVSDGRPDGVDIVLWLVALAGLSFAIGYEMGSRRVKAEALRNGSALESVDLETGKMRWEWK